MNQEWLDAHQIPGSVEAFVPGERCGWNAETIEGLAGILARLHSAAPLPEDAGPSWWYPSSLEALQACPVSIIHADVWQGNVIETTAGSLFLIDWEHAGIGHSVIDLAILIGDCESDEMLEAAMSGYGAHRCLSEQERQAIAPALRHTVEFRIAEKKRLGRSESLDREYRRLERANKLRL